MGAEVGRMRASEAVGALRLGMDPSEAMAESLQKGLVCTGTTYLLEMGILETLVLGPPRPLVMECSRWLRGLTDGSLAGSPFLPVILA